MHDQTFLHQREPNTLHQRHRRRRFYGSLLRVFLVVLAGWILLLLLAIGQLVAAGVDLQHAMTRASEDAEQLRFESAGTQMEKANKSLLELERSFYLLKQVWIFPGLDREFSNLDTLFVSSHQLIDSLSSLCELGGDILQLSGLGETALLDIQTGLSATTTFKDLPASTKRVILKRLSTASDDFNLLSARIRIASEEIELMRTNRFMSPLLGVLDPFIDQMKEVDAQLGAASVLAHLIPELSGLEGDRTHLLLFLNNDELRPGGGFIGTYGLLRVRDGEVKSLETKDVYAIDDPAASTLKTIPPEPLKKYNATTTWFFRDANWSPDFAASAKQSIALFEEESSPSVHIDDLIGFTPSLASALLSYLGPVQAGGQTFTSKNVPDLIEYQVERGFQEDGIPYHQRKEILSELVSQIQERLVSLPFSEWPHLFSLLSGQIQSKQLAIFSRNEGVQQTLTNAGWAGTIVPQTPDVQLFVDANLASLKSDPVVKRSVRYELFRNESGTWVGRTTITYNHEGTFDWRTSRYRTYARLYVPEGTTFVRVQGLTEGPVTQKDLGMEVFGGFVSIEPGEEHTVAFEYQLADSVVEAIAAQTYSLTLFKQMGARDYALTIDLDFDKNITHADPPENRSEWGDDRYRLNTKLDQDLHLEVGL